MGARSPMIWDEGQAERLLAGSPVVQLIQERSKVGPLFAHGSLWAFHSYVLVPRLGVGRAFASGSQPGWVIMRLLGRSFVSCLDNQWERGRERVVTCLYRSCSDNCRCRHVPACAKHLSDAAVAMRFIL